MSYADKLGCTGWDLADYVEYATEACYDWDSEVRAVDAIAAGRDLAERLGGEDPQEGMEAEEFQALMKRHEIPEAEFVEIVFDRFGNPMEYDEAMEQADPQIVAKLDEVSKGEWATESWSAQQYFENYAREHLKKHREKYAPYNGEHSGKWARFLESIRIAGEADKFMRERWDANYEILYREEDDSYVVAFPADAGEGCDPNQPTAVHIGCTDEFEDAEQLFECALEVTPYVDKLAAIRAFCDDNDLFYEDIEKLTKDELWDRYIAWSFKHVFDLNVYSMGDDEFFELLDTLQQKEAERQSGETGSSLKDTAKEMEDAAKRRDAFAGKNDDARRIQNRRAER